MNINFLGAWITFIGSLCGIVLIANKQELIINVIALLINSTAFILFLEGGINKANKRK